MIQLTHDYGQTKHTFDVIQVQSRIVEKREETMASEAAEHEADTCPEHGYGNCHFMCCSECRSGKQVYRKDYSKYQATLVTVRYQELFAVCPLCSKDVITSTTKVDNPL